MAPHWPIASLVIGAVRLKCCPSVAMAGEPGTETSGVSSAEEGLPAETGSQSVLWLFQACFWQVLEQ